MTVRELIRMLLEKPMDAQVFIGKGIGPAAGLMTITGDGEGPDRIYVILEPGTGDSPS